VLSRSFRYACLANINSAFAAANRQKGLAVYS
jgi:hypothetical protein